MSKPTMQVEELRSFARKMDELMPRRADLVREAADTILELRDDLQRANDAVRDAEHDESCAWDRVRKVEAENAKLQAENKNLIANYEMLSDSYMDSKQACEHLFTELKRYKSLLRAKLPERELMLIDEIQKLRERCADLYAEMITYSDAPNYNASVWAPKLRELGIEVS